MPISHHRAAPPRLPLRAGSGSWLRGTHRFFLLLHPSSWLLGGKQRCVGCQEPGILGMRVWRRGGVGQSMDSPGLSWPCGDGERQRMIMYSASPRSLEGLCSRDRSSATDFFLSRATALRLSRSRMSRKDRRSDSSLSRSAGHRDVPSTPHRSRVQAGCSSNGRGSPMWSCVFLLHTIPLLTSPGCRGRMRKGHSAPW